MTYSRRILKSFWLTPDVPQRRSRRNIYLKSLVTSSSSQPSSTMVLYTGGRPKTSTQDLTTRVPSLVFSRSKMGTALADTAKLSSLLLVNSVLMSARYFLTLTSLDSKYIQVRKEIHMEGYTAVGTRDLIMVTDQS